METMLTRGTLEHRPEDFVAFVSYEAPRYGIVLGFTWSFKDVRSTPSCKFVKLRIQVICPWCREALLTSFCDDDQITSCYCLSQLEEDFEGTMERLAKVFKTDFFAHPFRKYDEMVISDEDFESLLFSSTLQGEDESWTRPRNLDSKVERFVDVFKEEFFRGEDDHDAILSRNRLVREIQAEVENGFDLFEKKFEAGELEHEKIFP